MVRVFLLLLFCFLLLKIELNSKNHQVTMFTWLIPNLFSLSSLQGSASEEYVCNLERQK
jgi:hypothetical protein